MKGDPSPATPASPGLSKGMMGDMWPVYTLYAGEDALACQKVIKSDVDSHGVG